MSYRQNQNPTKGLDAKPKRGQITQEKNGCNLENLKMSTFPEKLRSRADELEYMFHERKIKGSSYTFVEVNGSVVKLCNIGYKPVPLLSPYLFC